MSYQSLFFTLLLIIVMPITVIAQNDIPQLEPLWVVQQLDSPESVQLSKDRDFLYVSNVNGGGGDKDGNGYITKLSVTGELLEQKWVTGLNAPKGMALQQDLLFVSDIDQVVIIDTLTASIKQRIDVPDAGFLNDIVAIEDGSMLISDSRNNLIYQLDKDHQVDVWLKHDDFGGINGLLSQTNQLLVTTMDKGELLSVNKTTHHIQMIATGMQNADGIVTLAGGGYLVSSWPGQLFYVAENGDQQILLDSQADNIYMNDFMLMGNIVLIPNWQPGRLSAYKISW